jgi:hypothetical protein
MDRLHPGMNAIDMIGAGGNPFSPQGLIREQVDAFIVRVCGFRPRELRKSLSSDNS